MKKIFFCSAFMLINNFLFAALKADDKGQDSSIHERFVASVLGDYDKEGRWIFVGVDSCNNIKSNKIVQVGNVYKAFKDRYDERDRRTLFIFNASRNILQHNLFYNCGHEANPVVGISVSMDRVKKLNKLSTDDLLNKYFEKDKRLKKQYKKKLNELIAVCFLKNIRVITEDPENVYYEIFN